MTIADNAIRATLSAPSASVDQFVSRHGIEQLLRHARESILRQFDAVDSLTLSVQRDPDDEGAEWLQIDAMVLSTPEAAAAARTAFRKELARLVPAADRSLIRLC